jgi:hypothetical protein
MPAFFSKNPTRFYFLLILGVSLVLNRQVYGSGGVAYPSLRVDGERRCSVSLNLSLKVSNRWCNR